MFAETLCVPAERTINDIDIPAHPWKMIAQDLFMYRKRDYLITVDYYSDFWEVDLLQVAQSSSTQKNIL